MGMQWQFLPGLEVEIDDFEILRIMNQQFFKSLFRKIIFLEDLYFFLAFPSPFHVFRATGWIAQPVLSREGASVEVPCGFVLNI